MNGKKLYNCPTDHRIVIINRYVTGAALKEMFSFGKVYLLGNEHANTTVQFPFAYSSTLIMITEKVEYNLQTDSSSICHLMFTPICKILTLTVLSC